MTDSSPQITQLKSIGALGGVRRTGQFTVTGDFMAIKALGSTVNILGVTGNISGLSGAAIPQGDTVLGEFQRIYASGDAIIYYN